MSKRYRLTLMGLSLIILLGIGFHFNGNLCFIANDFWFSSGLLLLILLSLVDQPFFSKDSNIFVNAVTAALSLLLIPSDERSPIFWGFLIFIAYLIVCSYILMWLRNRELSQENVLMQVLARLNRQLGKPETIFSAFFLWGAVRQFGLNSNQFNLLLWFWIVFMILNIPAFATEIDRFFDRTNLIDTENVVGKIFGVQSKNTFLVQLSANRKQSLKLFDFVEFLYSVDGKEHNGIVLDVYLLDQAQWIKVLTTSEIDGLFEKTVERHIPDFIYKVVEPPANDYLQRFVGLIYQDSNIEKIRFLNIESEDTLEAQNVRLPVEWANVNMLRLLHSFEAIARALYYYDFGVRFDGKCYIVTRLCFIPDAMKSTLFNARACKLLEAEMPHWGTEIKGSNPEIFTYQFSPEDGLKNRTLCLTFYEKTQVFVALSKMTEEKLAFQRKKSRVFTNAIFGDIFDMD